MAIRTLSAQERYREEETEPRRKLKKVRSVKVANLDRLRLSMRRERTRFNRSVMASLDDATDPSESSSAGISGTSSPNYMKDTTSSSARKGSLQGSSGNMQSNSASSSEIRATETQANPASSAKSASKLNKVSVQECSDPAGVNIPVIVKPEKSLKKVPSLKHSKKLSSKKSMKIRARYSQFPGAGTNQVEILSVGIQEFPGNTEINGGQMEIDSESPDVSVMYGQDGMVKKGIQKRGILEQTRSRRLTRIRSIRSSKARQRPRSRLSSGTAELMSPDAEVSNAAEPHYMKATSSQELKKNSDKGLTRTSSFRPLRILAKIPILRSKRSKVRKRPQATSLSGTTVDRATCSSVLKRAALSDGVELNPANQELEGATSLHVCPYSYCSIHGHRHHASSQPVKEFVSAKRKLFSNQKGEKTESWSRGEVEYQPTRTTEPDHLREIVSAQNDSVQDVLDATTESFTEAKDDGIDFLIKIYAKPRKKWATEETHNKDAETLDSCTYDQISVGDYEEKQAETLSETSGSEETQGALNDDQQEKHEGLKQHQNSNIAALSLPSDHIHLANRDTAVSSGGDLINIFSDKQKYTSMWQLIHQQLLSSDASMNEAEDVNQADEKGGDGITCREMSNLDLEQSEYNDNLSDDVDGQTAVIEKLESHQTAAIKLVQEALDAILKRNAESYYQQLNPVQETAKSFVRERVSTPTASLEETFSFREGDEIDGKDMALASAEKKHDVKQIGSTLLQKEPDAQENSGKKMSKSLSKLRKMFVTAKFIKTMERLKKINPLKPQYLSAKPASENERVNLRHLSMNEKKNTEEWMLDNALRQVISRLDPDQQRRVAQLVEAFETVTPEQMEKSNKQYPVKSVLAPGNKLAIPVIEEKKQFVEPEQNTPLSFEQVVKQPDGVLVSDRGVPQEYQAITTGDKILQESNETNMPDSTLELPEKSSKLVCVDSEFDDRIRGTEEPTSTPTVPPQFPTKNSEMNLPGEMNIFSNKQKYTSMWNMIYKHVVSSEASINKDRHVNGLDEEHDGDPSNYQEMNDTDSISSDYSIEDNDSQSAAREKPEIDQSAAIKLVKEALGAILKRHEQQTHLQSDPEHYNISDDARDLYVSTPTSYTEEHSIEGGLGIEKHTYSDVEDKLKHAENTSPLLQQQVECGQLKTPERKFSKSLSKLKKAIATARFIKAMERLTKTSPRKSQNLSSDRTSEEERVYLRHRSMDGRKNGEEWMLDFALRQVISKMAPDQQRRVERLVEAFETVHPEQKEKNIQSHTLKGEAADKSGLATPKIEAKNCYLKSQQQRSTSVEQGPVKKKDSSLTLRSLEKDHAQQVISSENTIGYVSLERNLQEHHVQQTSAADNIILQETNETAISESALDLSGNDTKLAAVVVKLEESSIGDEETSTAIDFPSPTPTANSEVKPEGSMATILFDRQKYTSMWHLIHQHVLSNEASTAGKQEVDGDKHGDEAIYDPEGTQNTQLKKLKVDEDNQSAIFDQSAAITLVKEAINAILQCHEQTSDQQSLKDHGRSPNNPDESCDTSSLAFTKENNRGDSMVKQENPEPKEKLREVDDTNASFPQQAEIKKSQGKMSTSINKQKKAIATAKFIKAMERLRKINPRKVGHLPAEMASDNERVYLRHLSVNERKNDEEWMLDYALRKVLSNLAPEKQKKVALIVEAFEIVKPEQKGIRDVTKSEWGSATETESTTDKKQNLESRHDSSTSIDDEFPPMHTDRLKTLNMLGKVATLENSKQQDHSIKFSEHKTGILESDDSNFPSHSQNSSKGIPVSNTLNNLTAREGEMDANPSHEPFQQAKDPEQDTNTNRTKAILCEKKKNTSLWHLIYQHIESVNTAEVESKLSERLTNEDHMNRGGMSAEMSADADSDDSDACSATSELTENDATKLIREAINDILKVPEDLEIESTYSNGTNVSEKGQRAAAEEPPKKSLSKGYSKLRQLIICNKFIKAMKKTRKSDPQKQTSPALNPNAKAGKAHLKTRTVGERKGTDEWMLDNVLQKVIAELAPVQQRRVSLLVEAFEKVPDSEQRGKGLSCSKTEFLDTACSKEDPHEKEDTIQLTNARCADSFGMKLNKSSSDKEVTTERIPQEICKERTSGLTNEFALDEGNLRSDSLCNIIATASDGIRIPSDTCKDPTDIDGADAPHVPLEERTNLRNEVGVQSEEGTSTDEQLAGSTEETSKPPQPESLKDEWNYRAHKDRSSEKSTSLWGLILQQVTTDMLEKNDDPKTGEIDADAGAQRDSAKTLERKTAESSQVSSKAKSCRDMGVQTPTSFEFQENEAIKLVEEAVEEILLLQDQISDTKPITSSTASEQEIYSRSIGDVSEPSLAATETEDIATSLHIVATSEEEKSLSKEKLSKSYSTLSKVILCKRFVKAMDKMRKLKAQNAQKTSQPPHTEKTGIPSLRQTSTSEKTSWDEGMLDNALQKVIGNLAPAKKQRVALLVQAFETVGSQPDSRGKASAS
ncbi:Calmodulin binding protein PICBP [Bienertia sinuspersici]